MAGPFDISDHVVERNASPHGSTWSLRSAAAEPAAAEASESKPKKKKKSKSAQADAEPKDDGQFGATKILKTLPGEGTPDGDTLRDAWAAFEVGDYRKARELAQKIQKSEVDGVALAAADVMHRTGVDEVQIAFLAACALAIIAIAWIYIPH
jgi:hypothetical protein